MYITDIYQFMFLSLLSRSYGRNDAKSSAFSSASKRHLASLGEKRVTSRHNDRRPAKMRLLVTIQSTNNHLSTQSVTLLFVLVT